MPKRIVAKVGSYEKNGETKNRYQEIGVILENQNGEYVLLDPTVDLAGVMMLQRIAAGKGEKVICSIFSDDNQRQQGSGYQQGGAASSGQGSGYIDGDEIPF